MSWAGRRVLVTGASGFVGSWLCVALLDAGAHVVGLADAVDPDCHLARSGAIRDVAMAQVDLRDDERVDALIAGTGVDTIFHLGAQTIVGVAHADPAATLAANVAGTWHVLDSCRRRAPQVERVVVASSDKAYGAAPRPTTEDAPLAGRAPYEVSKSAADLIAQSYRSTYGLPVVVARCGNIYGGGDLNWSRLVPGALRALLGGEALVLRSDGTYERDYLYVEDAVAGYLLLAEALDHGDAAPAYNLSDGPPRSVLDVYAAVSRAVGIQRAPVIAADAVGELTHQHLDDSLARTTLGWSPAIGLDEGLARTAAWYRELLGRVDERQRGDVA